MDSDAMKDVNTYVRLLDMPLLSRGNPPLEIRAGGRHLGIGCKCYAAALDLDRAHPTKACHQQRSHCAVISSSVMAPAVAMIGEE
jgi:hypothetical protein